MNSIRRWGRLWIACLRIAALLCGSAATADGLLEVMIGIALREGALLFPPVWRSGRSRRCCRLGRRAFCRKRLLVGRSDGPRRFPAGRRKTGAYSMRRRKPFPPRSRGMPPYVPWRCV